MCTLIQYLGFTDNFFTAGCFNMIVWTHWACFIWKGTLEIRSLLKRGVKRWLSTVGYLQNKHIMGQIGTTSSNSHTHIFHIDFLFHIHTYIQQTTDDIAKFDRLGDDVVLDNNMNLLHTIQPWPGFEQNEDSQTILCHGPDSSNLLCPLNTQICQRQWKELQWWEIFFFEGKSNGRCLYQTLKVGVKNGKQKTDGQNWQRPLTTLLPMR